MSKKLRENAQPTRGLLVQISNNLHRTLKIRALDADMTLQQYVVRLLEEGVKSHLVEQLHKTLENKENIYK